MPVCKRAIFVFSYLVISSIFLLFALEFGLWAAHTITGHHRLSTLEVKVNTQTIGEDVIKIAIYGGSSAAGYNSEASLDYILRLLLANAYPDVKFHIKNYARNGAPFHRHQAEQLKLSLNEFDVHFVYAGHNETANYFDDVGHFRPERNKSDFELIPPGEDNSNFYDWFHKKSRAIAISEKIHVKYVQGRLTRTPELLQYIPPKPNLFEQNKAIPPEILERIYSDFEADVRQIGLMAETSGKMLIYSNQPLHEEYSPLFSVFSTGLKDRDQRTFKAAYESGVDAYNGGEFPRAIGHFLDAAAIDDQPAILNYRLGRAYLELDEAEQGRSYIQKSIDNDGLPLRSSSVLGGILRQLPLESPAVKFIDSVTNFQSALDLDIGLTNDDLFADFHHPSAIGHLIIARGFITEMRKSGPLRNLVIHEDLPTIDRSGIDRFVHYLGLPNRHAQRLSFSRMRWHLFIGELAADQTDYANQALRYIDDYLNRSELLPDDLALASMFRAYVAAQTGDISRAGTLAEESLQISPSLVSNLLNDEVYLGANYLTGNWMKAFARVGLNFSEDGSTLLNVH